MNQVILSGWVYKAPKAAVFQTDKGESKYASYMLLVENGFDYRKKDLFFIYAFGSRAEWVEKYIKENTKIIVTGFLNNKKTADSQGVTYRLRVIASHHEFASYSSDEEREALEKDEASMEEDENKLIEQFLLSSVNDFYG